MSKKKDNKTGNIIAAMFICIVFLVAMLVGCILPKLTGQEFINVQPTQEWVEEWECVEWEDKLIMSDKPKYPVNCYRSGDCECLKWKECNDCPEGWYCSKCYFDDMCEGWTWVEKQCTKQEKVRVR